MAPSQRHWETQADLDKDSFFERVGAMCEEKDTGEDRKEKMRIGLFLQERTSHCPFSSQVMFSGYSM